MPKFRKRPVVVEAEKVSDLIDGARRNWALPEWMRKACALGDAFFLPDAILIRTLEGEMRGDQDDWIIRGVHGEIYPCKPDVFEATYEPVAGHG